MIAASMTAAVRPRCALGFTQAFRLPRPGVFFRVRFAPSSPTTVWAATVTGFYNEVTAVDDPPAVHLLAPVDGTSFPAAGTVTLVAEATELD